MNKRKNKERDCKPRTIKLNELILYAQIFFWVRERQNVNWEVHQPRLLYQK